MKKVRPTIVTILFFSVWVIVFFTISSLASDVSTNQQDLRASNTFDREADKIGKTAPYTFGGAIGGLLLAILIANLANKALKKVGEK